ncbi:MAG: alpha-hydroxy acid oxidase [Nocardioides sp.]|uniref:alpha-hydroxy acid oxidase n=1 Tax=Nocardioides sp. TaxID=35761 RepID=UPI0039E52C4B
MSEFAVLDDLYDAARATLSVDRWNHLVGGAGLERTVAANRAAFDDWAFRPRVLTGIEHADTSCEFLGIPLAAPIMTAPVGSDGLYHEQGHKAVARANAAAGTASVVPAASTFSLEEIAAAAPAAMGMFQLHAAGHPDEFLRLAARAAQSGYRALCVTVDHPTRGWRDRNLRDGFVPPAEFIGGNYETGPDGALSRQLGRTKGRLWSWDDLRAAMDDVELPVVIKGILTGEDAELAVDLGAAGLVVSNHGGRQIDGAVASLRQLPEVVEAVAGHCAIAVDGGVRRGTDILKALALGADVVLVGRPIMVGLAAAGEAGVAAVLRILREELTATMTLTGRPTVASVDASLLVDARR